MTWFQVDDNAGRLPEWVRADVELGVDRGVELLGSGLEDAFAGEFGQLVFETPDDAHQPTEHAGRGKRLPDPLRVVGGVLDERARHLGLAGELRGQLAHVLGENGVVRQNRLLTLHGLKTRYVAGALLASLWWLHRKGRARQFGVGCAPTVGSPHLGGES